jgi:hypothetical protein
MQLWFHFCDTTSMSLVNGVCANQQELGERSQQVKLMGQLYREAARVLIWLNDEDKDTGLAWSSIRLTRQEQELSTPQACEALKKIFNRDWFQRAWMYQESVLATRTEVLCSSHQIRRQHLASICLLVCEPKFNDVADLKFLRAEHLEILMSLLQLGRPGMLGLGMLDLGSLRSQVLGPRVFFITEAIIFLCNILWL